MTGSLLGRPLTRRTTSERRSQPPILKSYYRVVSINRLPQKTNPIETRILAMLVASRLRQLQLFLLGGGFLAAEREQENASDEMSSICGAGVSAFVFHGPDPVQFVFLMFPPSV